MVRLRFFFNVISQNKTLVALLHLRIVGNLVTEGCKESQEEIWVLRIFHLGMMILYTAYIVWHGWFSKPHVLWWNHPRQAGSWTKTVVSPRHTWYIPGLTESYTHLNCETFWGKSLWWLAKFGFQSFPALLSPVIISAKLMEKFLVPEVIFKLVFLSQI